MFSGSIRRSLLDARSLLPPSYLLPCHARFINTVSLEATVGEAPEPLLQSGGNLSSKTTKSKISLSSRDESSSKAALPQPTSIAPSNATTPISDSIRELLPLLRTQKPHFITAHLHDRPYLVTEGDIIRLPFFMHGVSPGDVLRLDRATTLGSRDYTLKAGAVDHYLWNGKTRRKQGYLDERLFICRAVILGTESEPMRFKEKTKRRQRRVKTVKSKHRYTILKVQEVTVRSLDEVDGVDAK